MKVISAIVNAVATLNVLLGFAILSAFGVWRIAENVGPLAAVVAGMHVVAVPVLAFLYYEV